MSLTSFDQLTEKIKGRQSPARMAVVAAADRHTLEAVALAQRDGIATPVMIGDRVTIKSYLSELGFPVQNARIIDAPSHEEAALRAVKLINDGKADFIMKGLVETAALMKVIVSKESNLRTGGIMSHLAFLEIPTYHKLLAISDAALNTYPTLEQKRQIIENAVAAMARMGIVNPKVAVMAAAEEVNPKIAESVEAHALKVMNLSGELSGCIVEGPISYDLAVDKEAALVKKYTSPVAGDADLLVAPNLTAGNLMIKPLLYSAKAKLAGFIVGAKVPVILASRSSTTQDKYLSIVLAAAAC